MKLLTIAIPTYNRESVLRNHFLNKDDYNDADYEFFISSNGKLKDPLFFSSKGIRLNEFETNMGAATNFEFLLTESNSKYVMLLSDEDIIDFSELPMFLNFLKSADNSLGFIKANLRAGDRKRGVKIELPGRYDFNLFIKKGLPLGTYMSGFVYKKAALNKLNLHQIMKQKFENKLHANVYPQNNLVLQILATGHDIVGYEMPLIVKGAEAGKGGDSHSHADTGLNPLIYSEAARYRQLAHQLKINDELTNDCRLQKLLRFHTKIFYYRAIVRAKLEKLDYVTDNRFRTIFEALKLNFIYFILRIINKLAAL